MSPGEMAVICTDATPLRAVMVKVMLDSPRAKVPQLEEQEPAAFVRECFRRYLGREPRQTESAEYAAALEAGRAEPRHVVRALLGSVEYQFY